MRRMRVFACPRRPRNSRSCLDEDAVDDLRDDRVAVADDAGEQLFAGAELVDHVPAELVLDRTGR